MRLEDDVKDLQQKASKGHSLTVNLKAGALWAGAVAVLGSTVATMKGWINLDVLRDMLL